MGTFYVAPSGNDNAAGTLERPWRTAQHAADVLNPGSIVYVRAGVYSESVSISRSGLPDSPITLAAYSGENATIEGAGSEWAGFVIGQGVSHVVIDGFTLRNFRGTGVDVQGTNSYIVLSRLDVGGASTGVRITWGYSGEEPMFGPADHVTIRDSHIHDNGLAGIDCTPGPCSNLILQRLTIENNGVGVESFGADGIAVERGYPVLIEDVVVHNNGGDGIDLNSRDRGPTPGVVVRRCIVAANHLNGVKLWASARLENCIIYDSGLTPLTAGAFSSLDLYFVNNVVAYNMVFGRSHSARGWAMDIGYADEGEPTPENIRVTLRNNIFAFNSYKDPDGETGIYLGYGVVLTESNNLYFSREDGEIYVASTDRWYSRSEIVSGVWRTESGQGSGDVGGDPRFTDMVGGDFHLGALGPAIDAGTPLDAPSDDLEGRLRPQGSGYDIGAYEHVSYNGPALRMSRNTYWSGLDSVAAAGSYVYLAWSDCTPVPGSGSSSYPEVWLRVSSNYGADFGSPIRISYNSGRSSDPAVAAVGDYVYVTWADNTPVPGSGSDYEIWLRMSSNNGVSFGPPIRMSTNAYFSGHPSIAVTGNYVYLTWQDDTPVSGSGSGYEIWMRVSSNKGASFGTAIRITRNTGESAMPSIAASGSYVYVAWQDSTPVSGSGGQPEIWMRVSSNNGASFGSAIRISTNTYDSLDPSVAASGSYVYVAWQDSTPVSGSGGAPEVWMRVSSNNGAALGSAIRMSTNAGYSGYPHVAASGIFVYVAWQDDTSVSGNGGAAEVWLRLSSNNGATFGSAIRISANAYDSLHPCVAASGNVAYVAWEDYTPVSGSGSEAETWLKSIS